ncbi:MAG: ATP phosphoribosyltransferase regulatory subunit [Burkholderiales bacterium]
MQKWLLPEYVEDILPVEAARVEMLRRRILDLFFSHGYEPVIPPMLEFVDSLLTGTGHDLDLRTFKLVDQVSGRMLGIRADMTPQVARIDAHLLNRQGVTRLCYSGTVLHTRPSGLQRSRELLQIGAEIYGHAGLESDIEIQTLLLRALGAAGVKALQFDLGHVSIFRSLIGRAGIGTELESELFQVLQAKDNPGLRSLSSRLDPMIRDALLLLPELYGGPEVLQLARRRLPALAEIAGCLDTLEVVGRQLGTEMGDVCFDLAELRGYHYHSGLVFAAYAGGRRESLARGGRYDDVGKSFGRARPATGFTMDLRDLVQSTTESPEPDRILAPYQPGDAALQKQIEMLRARGAVVVMDLPGHEASRSELACKFVLMFQDGQWKTAPCDTK